MNATPLITPAEACRRLGISRTTLDRYTRSGRVKCVVLRAGVRRTVRYAPEDIEVLARSTTVDLHRHGSILRSRKASPTPTERKYEE